MAKGTYENGQRDATIQSVADDIAEIKKMLEGKPCGKHDRAIVRHETILKVLLGIGVVLMATEAIKLLT